MAWEDSLCLQALFLASALFVCPPSGGVRALQLPEYVAFSTFSGGMLLNKNMTGGKKLATSGEKFAYMGQVMKE